MVNLRPIRSAPGDTVGRRRCRHRPRPFWRRARRAEKGRGMAKIFSSLEKGRVRYQGYNYPWYRSQKGR